MMIVFAEERERLRRRAQQFIAPLDDLVENNAWVWRSIHRCRTLAGRSAIGGVPGSVHYDAPRSLGALA
jgi:hypothetical protein